MRSPSRTRLMAVVAVAALLTGCGQGSEATTSSTTVSTTDIASANGLRPQGATADGAPVIRVVDGDTLHVLLDGRDVTVRMIGMNTPETVKPNSPVECYGPEASDYAKELLSGQRVTLEFDDSQGRQDHYGRTLAYVWLEQASGALSLVNLDEMSHGVAKERQYGPTPYAWKATFRAAQDAARAAGVGLWGACPT